MRKLFVRRLDFAGDFHVVGYCRNAETNRDFSVRQFAGRNGESITTLEEFDPKSGHLINVFWTFEHYASTPVMYFIACNETTLMESDPREIMAFVNSGFTPEIAIRKATSGYDRSYSADMLSRYPNGFDI